MRLDRKMTGGDNSTVVISLDETDSCQGHLASAVTDYGCADGTILELGAVVVV